MEQEKTAGNKIEISEEKVKRKRTDSQSKVKEEAPSKKVDLKESKEKGLDNGVSDLEKKLAELQAENARLRDLIPTETETRKLSITLPVTTWSTVDKHLKKENMKQASFFAQLAKSYFQKNT